MCLIDYNTNLFIIRHGETDCNRDHIVQGRGVDVPLNQTGVLQAKALAYRIKNLSLDVFYSSTLLRARQTTKILLEGRNTRSVTYLRDLEEMSWGFYEGMPRSPELAKAFDEMKKAWQKGDYEYRIKEGETLVEVRERGISALNSIVNKHAGKKILLVSHGRFIRIILASVLENHDLSRMKNLKQDNTAFNHLIFGNGKYRAEKLQCIEHLENLQ